ncbi:MAG: type I pullulanase [Sarcina sp.]
MEIKELYSSRSRNEIVSLFNSSDFRRVYHFNGELGAIYSKKGTKFRVWTPVAHEVILELYKQVDKNIFVLISTHNMTEINGIFECKISGDLNGVYYKYKLEVEGRWNSVVDIYAKSVSANGEYGLVVDMSKCSPKGWEDDKVPKLNKIIDSIIYEMHVRDFTIDSNSGILNQGKFLGVSESGTKIVGTDVVTGLEHLKVIGITHVHLLPVYDFETVDEINFSHDIYNWGYDPVNYNALEGSYSINCFDGESRIIEFKQMIMKLHDAGIRVIVDVVYNHTYRCSDSNFNKLVPLYYYRENYDGSYSNGSGCGNEIATERSMVRKFIVDSILFWANEYHIDGFRFDLMGLYDTKTLNLIREELDKIDKKIIIYGEGWTGGDTPLATERRCLKDNIKVFEDKQIAAFNDEIRDGIKGHTFIEEERGFVSGDSRFNNAVKVGITGGVNLTGNFYPTWANNPMQVINYESAHDNYTLFDKLQKSNKNAKESELIAMNKLAFAVIITAQGIPFIHSGEEFLRTKKNKNGELEFNSYNLSDSVNMIEWERKVRYIDVFNYYKKMIIFRKKHKCFRLESFEEIRNRISFGEEIKSLISFTIECEDIDNEFKKFLIIHNGNDFDLDFRIGHEEWILISDGTNVEDKGIREVSRAVLVYKQSSFILGMK